MRENIPIRIAAVYRSGRLMPTPRSGAKVEIDASVLVGAEHP